MLRKAENLVTPRMRRVSRNTDDEIQSELEQVTPRMRRVSRNKRLYNSGRMSKVTPRMRRVSRNMCIIGVCTFVSGHASHEACE